VPQGGATFSLNQYGLITIMVNATPKSSQKSDISKKMASEPSSGRSLRSAIGRTPAFTKIALIGRRQTEGLAKTLGEIIGFFRERGLEVMVERSTARAAAGAFDLKGIAQPTLKQVGKEADLAIVIGGDGTMLGFARQIAEYDIPMVGINHGRLGFITDIALDAWRKALGAILDGDYTEEHRVMLQAKAYRGDKLIWEDIALNDVVISRSSRSGMIELEVHVNRQFMYSQRADGLIISTPTGSTAYALSAHGPILHPGVGGLVLVPVAPQSLSNRPICLPDTANIHVAITESRLPRVACDMQMFGDLAAGDVIEVRKSPYTARFLHPKGYSYFNTLRTKLNWHEMPQLKLKKPKALL
jgi:NAD+ kinase